MKGTIMDTINHVTSVAISLILMNLAFFIYLVVVSQHIFSNRRNLRETTVIMNELVDMYQDVTTRDEEDLAREMIDQIEDHLDSLY
jgi:uncharacterized protein YoxC